MHVEVEVCRTGEAPRRVRLKNGVTMIGRAPDSELVLPDVGVSRRHARLLLDSSGLTLEDLGSGNGTLVGGERVARVALREGDEVLIDPFTLRIRLSGPVAASDAGQGGVGQDDTALLDQREAEPTVEPQRQARLVSVAGPALQPSYAIGPAGLSMGRSEEREVVLLDPAASRLQAEIVEVDGVYWLRDHGSANGTFVNGRRVRERPLQHDDRIRVGATELRFELSGSRPAAPDPTLNRRSILPAPVDPKASRASPSPASAQRAPAGRGLAIAVGVGVAVMVLAVGASALAALAWKLSQQVDPSQALVAPAPIETVAEVEPAEVKPAEVKPAEVKPAEPPATAPPATSTVAVATAPTAAATAASPDPGSAMEQGLARFKEGAYLEATALFYRALKEDPTSLDAERMCYVSCEFLAIQTLREDARSRQVTPEQREDLYRQAVTLGRKAARSGAELDEADLAIAAALEWYPQDPTLVELRSSVEARRARATEPRATESRASTSKASSPSTARTKATSTGSSASDRRLARQYLDEGMQAVSDGRLVVARDRLARALSLDSSLSSARSNLADVDRILEDRARTAWSQGQAQEAAGNIGGALTAYEQVVAYASSKQASLKTQAQQRITALR